MFAVGMRIVLTNPQDDAPRFMKKGLMGVVKRFTATGNISVLFDGHNDPTTVYLGEAMPCLMENE